MIHTLIVKVIKIYKKIKGKKKSLKYCSLSTRTNETGYELTRQPLVGQPNMQRSIFISLLGST